MGDQASRFIGSIPENYDNRLGPRIFFDYAEEMAKHVAALSPKSVLELAAGTGIVRRRLRNVLTSDCQLLVTDLNEPMLNIAKEKFTNDENVQFKVIDAMNLEFDNNEFDVVVCQF